MGHILSVPVWNQNARNLQDFSWNQIPRSLEKPLKIRAHKKTLGKNSQQKGKILSKTWGSFKWCCFFCEVVQKKKQAAKRKIEEVKKRNIKGALDRILPFKMLNGKTSQQKERFHQKLENAVYTVFLFGWDFESEKAASTKEDSTNGPHSKCSVLG